MEFDPTKMPPTPPVEPAAPARTAHCWHKAPVQHTHLKRHADVRCCHCGVDLCVTLEPRIPTGHGPHTPNADQQLLPKRGSVPKFCDQTSTEAPSAEPDPQV